jgi:putative transposase
MERLPYGKYTKEFRQEAVKLVVEGGLSIPEVGRRLSVAPSSISNWVKAFKAGKLGEVGKTHRVLSDGEMEVIRLKRELAEGSLPCAQRKRIRKKLGIKCKQKKRFKATTDSRHNLPVAENLLNQRFEVDAPNKVWVSDITYIPTDEGWLYLAGHKDLCSGKIVGYAMSERMKTELVSRSLFKAVSVRRPGKGLIQHSDRGSRYCAHDYRKLLEQLCIEASMSRKGNCYDNAPMEKLLGNAQVGYLSPAAYEKQFYEKRVAA